MRILADWPAPAGIIAGTTTCLAGDMGVLQSDTPQQCQQHRAEYLTSLGLTQAFWPQQVHGTAIIDLDKLADRDSGRSDIQADGVMTTQGNRLCQVLTADCVPICLCDKAGRQIMALHAGWKGVLANIVGRGIQQFTCQAQDILVWIGPFISQSCYEIDEVIYHHFLNADNRHENAFLPTRRGHWLLDLGQVLKNQCQQLGVRSVYEAKLCTYQNKAQFFSYRRQKEKAGRQVTFILKK